MGYDDDDAAPAAAAAAPDPPAASWNYFDPEDMPAIANAATRNDNEDNEAFFRRRVLALIDDRRDAYVRWAYDSSRKESWSWCSWLARQWRALRPMGLLADATLPTYTRVIDDAVLRNISAAVVANQENAAANPRRSFYTAFERDNRSEVNNALRWEDHLSNAFEVARVSMESLVGGKDQSSRLPNALKGAKKEFKADMEALERALRRHQILLHHYIREGEREMRTGQASDRFVLTALASGRIAELAREIAELKWPAMNASAFDLDGYCGNVTLRVKQIIALCPTELQRVRSDRGGYREFDVKNFPAASGDDDEDPDDIAYRALACYTTWIRKEDILKDDELYRVGAYERVGVTGRTPTYKRKYLIRPELCAIIWNLLQILRPIDGPAASGKEIERLTLMLEKQLEIARTEAVDLYFPLSAADHVDALAARAPNWITLVGAAAIVALEQLLNVHEVARLARTQQVDAEVRRLTDNAAREASVSDTVRELNDAWKLELDMEFAEQKFGGPATTAAYHLVPEKLVRIDGRKPADMSRQYGRPLTRIANSTEVDSDYWFDRRTPVHVLTGEGNRVLEVEIYTAIRMNVMLSRGIMVGRDAYASITNLDHAMRLDYAHANSSNLELTSPVSVEIKLTHERLAWRASRCHKVAVALARLRNVAERATGAPQQQITEAIQKAEADLLECVTRCMPAGASAVTVTWMHDTLRYMTMGFMPAAAMWQALLSYLAKTTSTMNGLGRLLEEIKSVHDPASDYFMVAVLGYATFSAMAVGTMSTLWLRRGVRTMQGLCQYVANNAGYYFGITLGGLIKYGAVYGLVSWQYQRMSNAFFGWEMAKTPDGAVALARNLWHCSRPSVYLGEGWNTCVARLERDALVHTTAMAVTKGAVSSELMAYLLEALGRQGITEEKVTQGQLRTAITATAKQFQSRLEDSDKPISDYGDALVAAMQAIMTDRIRGRFTSTEAMRMSWCDSVSRSMLKVGAAVRQVGVTGETLRATAAAGWGAARTAFGLCKFGALPKMALAGVNIALGRCMRRATRAGGRSVDAMVAADALDSLLGAVALSNNSVSEEEKDRILAMRNTHETLKKATGDARAERAFFAEAAGNVSVSRTEEVRRLARRSRFDNLREEDVPMGMMRVSKSRDGTTTPRARLDRRPVPEPDSDGSDD